MEPTDQDRLLVSLLTPARLLEFLRSYVLFDRKVGKIVARYQQFFGIRALLARIRQVRPDGGREGGVVWHTTGSGKSFTMVFLTKALLLVDALAECRVVVVTDRVDLEDQLSRNFISGGAFGSAIASQKDGEKSRAMTGRDLARRIGSGTERITFTLVHKFNSASKLPECRNDSANLIVLVDEGHRSHGGETHERMKKALPRAAYIAFTGTPLLKDEKTSNKFGPIVHAYTMQRAVEDETVAPLLYEERVPELTINEEAVNRWFDKITAGLSDAQRGDLKKKFAKKGAIYGAAGRIELIAWDIATHFSENIKKLGLGLKGQVATDSKLDAIRYKKALDDTGLVTSAVVISPPDTREGNAEVDEDTLPEVQKWWKQTVAGERPGRRDLREAGRRRLRHRRRAGPADRGGQAAHRLRRAAQHRAVHRQAAEGPQPDPGRGAREPAARRQALRRAGGLPRHPEGAGHGHPRLPGPGDAHPGRLRCGRHRGPVPQLRHRVQAPAGAARARCGRSSRAWSTSSTASSSARC